MKGTFGMNVAYFLIPKANVVWLSSDASVEDAIARLDESGYTAVPLLSPEGHYAGTFSEGDLMRHLVRSGRADLTQALRTPLVDVQRRAQIRPVGIEAHIEELFDRALEQNFVPVVDSRGAFVGIVRRREILQRSMSALRDEREVDRAVVRGSRP